MSGWICITPGEEPDHDWQIISDWFGDPEVVNGTQTFYFRRCRVCGEEDHETPVTYDDLQDDEDY